MTGSGYPRLEKHGCRDMILPWSYHDHGETWSWSCHDNGMAAMFLSMDGMIHGMIMVWLPCFPWFIPWSWYDHYVLHVFLRKKLNVLSIFSQTVRVIYHYMAHLTSFRGIYASKVASQQNWTKNTPGNFGVFSVITKKQVLITQQFQYNIHITAFSYFW